MSFFDSLQAATHQERQALLTVPVIQEALLGRVSLPGYVGFLTQAYHHVRHTVPLLMACGARLPSRLEWLRAALCAYIEEEYGHEQWILDDLAACGSDPQQACSARPDLSIELMLAYLYDCIARGNPVGLFGMINVLEGTSIVLATQAAASIEKSLALPRTAFSYLNSHGVLDQEHLSTYRALMDRLDRQEDQDAVIHSAKVVYLLYAEMFRGLPRAPESEVQHAIG
jgi:hypothetical protein